MTSVKIFQVQEFERRLQVLSGFSKRQSDRNMPRMVFNTGVSTLSVVKGQKYVELSLLTIIELPCVLDDEKVEKQFSKLLWNGISLYCWFSAQSIHKELLPTLAGHIKEYLTLFNDIIGPQRKMSSPLVGNKFPKFHGLTHFVLQIKDTEVLLIFVEHSWNLC